MEQRERGEGEKERKRKSAILWSNVNERRGERSSPLFQYYTHSVFLASDLNVCCHMYGGVLVLV